MKSPETKNQAPRSVVKENYIPPVLKDWGTLGDVTLSAGVSGSADGGKILFTRTRL
jgi:hypothetical protein